MLSKTLVSGIAFTALAAANLALPGMAQAEDEEYRKPHAIHAGHKHRRDHGFYCAPIRRPYLRHGHHDYRGHPRHGHHPRGHHPHGHQHGTHYYGHDDGDREKVRVFIDYGRIF